MLKKLIIIFVSLLGLFLLACVAVFFAVNHGLTNVRGVIDRGFPSVSEPEVRKPIKPTSWINTDDWLVFGQAVYKDREVIRRAAQDAGVEPRVIMAVTAVEQLRLYNSDRQIFKEIFSPLKILGTQVQFSWGVAGMKGGTAELVEKHLKNKKSVYYLGPEYEHLLDFKTENRDEERFERLTDQRNRYYQYLYVGLYLKQIMVSWQKEGYDLSQRPEILGTLYNIGFGHSDPKANPAVGGAEIEIGGEKYTFGGLTHDIYWSGELLSEFPRP